MAIDDEQEQIGILVRRLSLSLGVSPEAIEVEVSACYHEWDDAPVRDFVPIFVERAVRTRLRDRLASAQ